MELIKRIDEDLTAAQKAQDAVKVSTLRLLKSALHNQRIASGKDLSEAEVVKVIGKEAKQRQEAIASYQAAGRAEQAATETQELEIIQQYLPQPLSQEELEGLIHQAIEQTGAATMADMGKVMAAVNQQAAGRADGAALAQLVKAKLAGD